MLCTSTSIVLVQCIHVHVHLYTVYNHTRFVCVYRTRTNVCYLLRFIFATLEPILLTSKHNAFRNVICKRCEIFNIWYLCKKAKWKKIECINSKLEKSDSPEENSVKANLSKTWRHVADKKTYPIKSATKWMLHAALAQIFAFVFLLFDRRQKAANFRWWFSNQSFTDCCRFTLWREFWKRLTWDDIKLQKSRWVKHGTEKLADE